MVYTSVIIVLPLGSLVAQQIADPAAFSNGELSNGTTRVGNHANDRFGKFTTAGGGGGGGSHSKHLLIHNKNNMGPDWSQSDKESGVTSIVTAGTKGANNTTYHHSNKAGGQEPMSAVDIELARIDADLEAGVVRVEREIQQDEEVL